MNHYAEHDSQREDNTMPTKHSKTPWTPKPRNSMNAIENVSKDMLNKVWVYEPYSKSIVNLNGELIDLEANAQHIVKCVNSHEELINLANKILDEYTYCREDLIKYAKNALKAERN